MHPSALAKRLYIFLFVIISIFYIYGLGRLPLLGPDEPRYAQVAREMFVRGDLVTPTLGGHTWFEKPALLYWLMMASFKIFGVNEWGARFGPAICGLLTIAAVWFVARAIERSSEEVEGFGFWAALVAASLLGLVVFSRAASFDVVITMTTTWALAFFLLHELKTKQGFLFGFYICVGLSLLAKGLVGIVIPFGVVGFYFLLRRAWPDKHIWLSLFWGVPLTLAVSALWYGPVIARHGWSFVDEFFIQHHFARYVSNKYHHPQPLYFYPAIILMLALPWTAFFIDSLLKARRWTWRGADSLSVVRVFSLAWLALPIVFFSFSGSKLPGYILPALPAAAFLIVDGFYRSVAKWSMQATGVICLALAAGGFVYALQSRQIPVACAVLIAAPMAVAASFAILSSDRARSLLVIFGATALFVLVVLACAAPFVAQRESVKDLLQLADARGYANAPVLAQRSDDRTAQFYAHDRVVYNADGEPITFDEITLEQARALGPRLVVFIPAEYVDQFRGAPNLEILGDNGRVAVLGWKP